MECTDFCETLRSIQKHEAREFLAAVNAHGGEYVFDDPFERPTILAYAAEDLHEYPYDVYCVKVEGNSVEIYGYKTELLKGVNDEPVRLVHVCLGERQCIIQALPEIGGVNSVAEKIERC